VATNHAHDNTITTTSPAQTLQDEAGIEISRSGPGIKCDGSTYTCWDEPSPWVANRTFLRRSDAASYSDDSKSTVRYTPMLRDKSYTPHSMAERSEPSPWSSGVFSPMFTKAGSGGRRRQSRRLDSMTLFLPTPPASLRKEFPESGTPQAGSAPYQGSPLPTAELGTPPYCALPDVSETGPSPQQDGHIMSTHHSGRRHGCPRLSSPESWATYAGPSTLATCNGRTVLPRILEDVVICEANDFESLSKREELEALVAQLTFEKHLVEAKLNTIAKDHDARMNPFRDAFDDNRRLRAELDRTKADLGDAVELTARATDQLAKVAGKMRSLQQENATLKASLTQE
jgi:hypothetical protein